MNLTAVVFGIALALVTSLTLASKCAPTPADARALAKAYADYDATITQLGTGVASGAEAEKISALGKMISANQSLKEASQTQSEAYCKRAEALIDTIFRKFIAASTGDDRVQYLVSIEKLAERMGIALSQSQRAEVDGTVRPLVEKGIKDLDDAIAAKELNRIETAHENLRELASTSVGKTLLAEAKLQAAVDAYGAIEKTTRGNGPNTTRVLAQARSLLAANKYEEAARALSAHRGNDTPEIIAFNKELGGKWFAAKLAEADTAMNAVRKRVSDESVAKASSALITACRIAERYDITHTRCKE